MKAGAYVEFTGILPVELQKIKRSKKDANKKFKGTVVKKIGKDKVEVKPKYMRFTVSVKIADVTQIKESAFTKKQKFPNGKPDKKKVATPKTAPKATKKPIKKKPVKKVTVKGDGPVKVVSKPNTPKTFKDEVAEKIESGDKKTEKPISDKYVGGVDPATPDAKPTVVKTGENGAVEVVDPPATPKEFPLNSEAMEKMPKKEGEEKYNWVKDDPINSTQAEQELIDEQTSGGGLIRWSVIALLLAAALGVYFLLR